MWHKKMLYYSLTNVLRKTLNLSYVMDPVISRVNFILAQVHWGKVSFKIFLKEIETDYPDIPYFTAVWWLSSGKILSRFF